MSDQSKVYPTRKRRNNEPSRKRQKTEAVAESSPIQTKLTDVNIDCLEIVSMNLNFVDLLNIAHTNKELKPAADLAFARKFGKILFVLFVKEGQRQNLNVQVDENSIQINDLQTALRTVRCFGHLITKLIVSFGCYPSQHQYRLWSEKLIHYASTYCSESLDAIVFDQISTDGLNDLEKPFVKAKVVVFDSCTLGRKMTPLNTLFPKVYCLRLHDAKAASKCIELHLPHLQQLTIKGSIPTPTTENTMGILRLNTQLRALVLDTNCTTKLLRCANESLRLLDYLDISCCDKDFLDFGGDIIQFERLIKLKILFDGNSGTPNIPILSKQLKEFTWEFRENVSIIDKNFTDFLKKHPSINILNMVYKPTEFQGFVRRIYEGDISIIAEYLPMLQELSFEDISISHKTVIPFIGKCKSLKNFRFRIRDAKKFDHLVAELDNQWKASIGAQDQITLERKV